MWQVTREAYESCTYQAGSLDEWTAGPQTSADLFVHSLAVGENYFISVRQLSTSVWSISQLYTTLQPPCDMPYFVPMLIGC